MLAIENQQVPLVQIRSGFVNGLTFFSNNINVGSYSEYTKQMAENEQNIKPCKREQWRLGNRRLQLFRLDRIRLVKRQSKT